MSAVFLDTRSEVTADRARRGFGRIGDAHRIAPFRNCAVGFKYHHDDLAGAHEIGQLAKKWPLAMHCVEAFCFGLGEPKGFDRNNLELRGVDAAQNVTRKTALHSIGLDDCESVLSCQNELLLDSIGFIVISYALLTAWVYSISGASAWRAIRAGTFRELAPWSCRFRRGFRRCEFPPRLAPRIFLLRCLVHR